MPCCPRVHLDGFPLHIVQHSHNRYACFFCEADYQSYLHWLGEALARARDSCENVNRWLRECFPRGVSIDDYTDAYIAQVQDIINRRPRKILNGLTPYEIRFASPRSPTVRT